jgi:Zn-dependent protease
MNTIQQISIWFIPVLFAITVHEAAHGWMAEKLGDDTARKQGRVSFNPIRHIDLIGTIILPIATFFIGGFLFGWAKPVPVNWFNLRKPRRDSAFVALAGPAANLLMAIFWALLSLGIMKLESAEINWLSMDSLKFFIYIASAGIFFNFVLMILNLVPILPLDGGRILFSILPPTIGNIFIKLEPFGLIILVALLISGLLGQLILPIVLYGYIFVGGIPEILNLLFA